VLLPPPDLPAHLPALPCSPEDTYAWLPGSRACLRCIKGVPELCDQGPESNQCPSAFASPPITASSPGRWN